MKIKNKINVILTSLILSATSALTFSSCGDSLLDTLGDNEEVIQGNKVATIDQAAGMFLSAQQYMHDLREHKYQYQFNLHIDNYSGYLSLTQNFDGKQPSIYAYFPDFAGGPQTSFFWTSQQVLPIIRGANDLDIRELGAIASIIYSYSALELSDIYGPFPWWDYKQEKQDPPLTYYPLDQIYDSLFVDLKAAVDILQEFPSTSDEHQTQIQKILNGYDRICGKDIATWIEFANSIRLRMAVRMSNVNPERAKQEAADAIAAGVLRDHNVAYDETLEGKIHPMTYIATKWNDTRLNASFENMLKRLKSPMLAKWFDKNNKNITDKEGNVVMAEGSNYIGIRAGIDMPRRDDTNQFLGYSSPSSTYSYRPVSLFKLSEVLFLKAEAKLRWNVGTEVVSFLYKKGIEQSFKDEGIGISSQEYKDYIDLESADATIDYVDPQNPRNNTPGIITIGVKWNNADDNETKLEKIITQKYIANFPMGLEAWNDLRRTGYPKVFPVDDIGDGSLGNGKLIRRIPWVATESSTAADIESSGIPALGGGNYQMTRLWWDTGNNGL